MNDIIQNRNLQGFDKHKAPHVHEVTHVYAKVNTVRHLVHLVIFICSVQKIVTLSNYHTENQLGAPLIHIGSHAAEELINDTMLKCWEGDDGTFWAKMKTYILQICSKNICFVCLHHIESDTSVLLDQNTEERVVGRARLFQNDSIVSWL